MLKFETCVNPSQMIWENREQSPTRRLVMGSLFFASLCIYIGVSYKILDVLKLKYTDRT